MKKPCMDLLGHYRGIYICLILDVPINEDSIVILVFNQYVTFQILVNSILYWIMVTMRAHSDHLKVINALY